MAELSIVGFVVGSLSFIVTVRSSIKRLLDDADQAVSGERIRVRLRDGREFAVGALAD
jgi:hypothetical protein